MNDPFKISGWLVVILVIIALLIGALVGSVVEAQKGHSGGGATIFVARQAPPASKEVSLSVGFAPVLKSVLPAVVNISSTKMVQVRRRSPLFESPFFRRFFDDQFDVPRERREQSLGSGVIISPDGHILTKDHVIRGASEIQVYWSNSDRKPETAKVVGTDSETDIAVLKVAGSNLPAVVLGNSDAVEVGNFVLAIGNPFGIGQTTTMGIVSAIGRGDLGIESYENFIQTDAAINPGNSGGALINERGELIAINTAIISQGRQGGNEGVGLAIPINMARHVMEQILKNGKVVRGYLGVTVQDVTPQIAQAFGLKTSQGALVADVSPGGPGAKTGLQRGDAILALNGKAIEDSRNLRLQVASAAPGSEIQLTVVRQGKELHLQGVLGEMPSGPTEQQPTPEVQPEQEGDVLQGVVVEDLTADVRQQLLLSSQAQGVVVVDIATGSPAAQAGLRRGDVVQSVNHKPVKSVGEFQAIAKLAGTSPAVLLVNRQGTSFYMVVGG